MFLIFETPVLIILIVVFYLLFFLVLFLIKLPEEHGKQQRNTKTSAEITRVAKESQPECTMFGFLRELPKGDPIPDECMSCQKLVECLMKKNEFEWYSRRDSSKKSEP
ncbi:MAG: hypothetical protein AOA66_1012 [Candidatus Bathyarchaeota archaeon BA2]|nr:MAG: hypothetical protein AOA66_1012 [Candidatus Bathyarchaeota archaeon BA2]